jgi:hypothetical protein
MVQAAHAAFEAGTLSTEKTPTNNYLIMCAIPSEAALLSSCEKLDRMGIHFTLFREPDLGNRATALCTEALTVEQSKKMSSFRLWREPKEEMAF